MARDFAYIVSQRLLYLGHQRLIIPFGTDQDYMLGIKFYLVVERW